MRKTRRAFERALAAAEADGPAALAEVRLDFAEWLKDREQFQEAYDLLRPVVEGPQPSLDEQFAQTAIVYLEVALRAECTVDRPLFVARLDRAIENASSLAIGASLRGAAVILFILADWREAAIRQAVLVTRDLPLLQSIQVRSALAVNAAEVLSLGGLPAEALKAIQTVWEERHSIKDEDRRYRLADRYLSVQLMLENIDAAADLIDELLHAAQATGDPTIIASATGTAGSVYLSLERIPEAIDATQRALALLPQNAPARRRVLILSQLGRVLRHAGRDTDAAPYFEEAGRLAAETSNFGFEAFLTALHGEATADDEQCWEATRRGAPHLFTALARNPTVEGIAGESGVYEGLFHVGIRAAERLLTKVDHARREEIAKDLVLLLDSVKCVAAREGFRRHSFDPPIAVESEPWRAHVNAEFWLAEKTTEESMIRGVRRGPARVGWPRLPLQLPPAADDLTATFPELRGMDLGARTLLLHFFFAGDVLLIFPWLVGNGGESVLLPDDGTPFGVNDCRTGFTNLAEEHTSTVDRIVSGILARDSSAAASMSANLRSIYARVFGMLEGPALLEWLRAAIGDLRQCHLVLLPDGPLYEFPLHALPVETEASAGSQRLSELFASVSYATSARTLALQYDRVRGRRQSSFRGVLMATPRPDLPGIRYEVAALAKAVPGKWWIHGDTDHRSTYRNFLQRHRAGSVLWLSGHGGSRDEHGPEAGFQFVDEPLNVRKLLGDAFDFSASELIVLNACWMGAMRHSGYSHEITAFNTVLTMRGSSRITSALWAVDDGMAVVFAEAYAHSLNERCFGLGEREPFAFARALADGIAAIRTVEDGRFDHDFFWAPWVMYGIG